MPLFGELSRSSYDSFESESDSSESRDDPLNSPKSGIFYFSRFSSLVVVVVAAAVVVVGGFSGAYITETALPPHSVLFHTAFRSARRSVTHGVPFRTAFRSTRKNISQPVRRPIRINTFKFRTADTLILP